MSLCVGACTCIPLRGTREEEAQGDLNERRERRKEREGRKKKRSGDREEKKEEDGSRVNGEGMTKSVAPRRAARALPLPVRAR